MCKEEKGGLIWREKKDYDETDQKIRKGQSAKPSHPHQPHSWIKEQCVKSKGLEA